MIPCEFSSANVCARFAFQAPFREANTNTIKKMSVAWMWSAPECPMSTLGQSLLTKCIRYPPDASCQDLVISL
jgi:hypothetical protein